MNSKKNMEALAVGWLKVNGYGWIGNGGFGETVTHHAKEMGLPKKALGDVFRFVLPVFIWGEGSTIEDIDKGHDALQVIMKAVKKANANGKEPSRLIMDIFNRWVAMLDKLKPSE